MSSELDGNVYIVTGGSKGFGLVGRVDNRQDISAAFESIKSHPN